MNNIVEEMKELRLSKKCGTRQSVDHSFIGYVKRTTCYKKRGNTISGNGILK